jgi:chromosome segregation ATPase
MLRSALLTTSALAALLLAGCGDSGRSSKSDYEQRVRSIYADIQEAFQKTNVTSTTLLADRIEAAQGTLRSSADELEEIEPPEQVEEETEELVEGMREYADDLDELHEAAVRGDRAPVEAFTSGVAKNEAVKRMAEAAEEMKFKGYDLGPIADE